MAYKILISASAAKDIKKLGQSDVVKIRTYLNNSIATLENPRSKGKPLSANLKGFWRYRAGDFRVICEIDDEQKLVKVIGMGHRSIVYEKTN